MLGVFAATCRGDEQWLAEASIWSDTAAPRVQQLGRSAAGSRLLLTHTITESFAYYTNTLPKTSMHKPDTHKNRLFG